jgi:hypothetical protein
VVVRGLCVTLRLRAVVMRSLGVLLGLVVAAMLVVVRRLAMMVRRRLVMASGAVMRLVRGM